MKMIMSTVFLLAVVTVAALSAENKQPPREPEVVVRTLIIAAQEDKLVGQQGHVFTLHIEGDGGYMRWMRPGATTKQEMKRCIRGQIKKVAATVCNVKT